MKMRSLIPPQIQFDAIHIGALAIPLIMTQLAQVALTTVDIVMLGLLGPSEIAAGGLALSLFNLFRAIGSGLVTGTGNLVAHARGDRHYGLVRQFLRAGLALGTLGALVAAAMMCLAEKPLIWLGQDPATSKRAAQFLTVLAPAMFPCLWFQALRQFSIGMRRPGPLVAITVGCTVINGLLDYLLMFGKFGFPKLGLIGIAWATASVYLLSFLLFFGVVLKRRALARHASLAIWKADWQTFVRTWKMGILVAATFGSETAFFAVITLLIGSIGTHALAAQTIANQLIYIVFMVSSGLSQAVSICISHACAKREYQWARRLGYSGLTLGLAVMALVAIPYLAFPNAIVSPFLSGLGTADADVARLAANLVFIAAFLQFFDCSQNIGVGILRGIGEVTKSFQMTLIGYWVIGLPAVYSLGMVLGWGIYGIWIGLAIALGSTAILLWFTFEMRLKRMTSAPGLPVFGTHE